MKQMIISLILFSAILLLSFTGINFLDDQVLQLSQNLGDIEAAMMIEDWPLANQAFTAFYDYWKEDHFLWHILLGQDDLAELEANIARIYAFIKKEDSTQGLSELFSLHSLLNHLREKEQANWKNIL